MFFLMHRNAFRTTVLAANLDSVRNRLRSNLQYQLRVSCCTTPLLARDHFLQKSPEEFIFNFEGSVQTSPPSRHRCKCDESKVSTQLVSSSVRKLTPSPLANRVGYYFDSEAVRDTSISG